MSFEVAGLGPLGLMEARAIVLRPGLGRSPMRVPQSNLAGGGLEGRELIHLMQYAVLY